VEELMLKVLDTLSGEHKYIDIDEDLEREIKRSYWREDQQERRYYKRCSEYCDEYKYNVSNYGSIEDRIIRDDERRLVAGVINALEPRDRLIIINVYYNDMSLKDVSTLMHVSTSYMSRLHARALQRLKQQVLEQYDYYV
jgi:RNA polymerase sigma factor (sigma-70 family)